jgi:hypothetical protein
VFDSLQSTIDSGALLIFYGTLCLGAGMWFVLSVLLGDTAEAVGDALDGMDGDLDGDGDGNVLSIRNLMLFCIGFGGAGASAVSLGAGLWVSVISGVGGGFLVAAAGVTIFRVLRRQEATTSYHSEMLVGSEGTVTLDVRPSGLPGEISAVDNRGAQVRLSASPAKGVTDTMSVGTVVMIKAIHGSSAVVAPFDE